MLKKYHIAQIFLLSWRHFLLLRCYCYLGLKGFLQLHFWETVVWLLIDGCCLCREFCLKSHKPWWNVRENNPELARCNNKCLRTNIQNIHVRKKFQKIIIILNFLNEFYLAAWNYTKNKQRFSFWLTRILWGFELDTEWRLFLMIVRNFA